MTPRKSASFAIVFLFFASCLWEKEANETDKQAEIIIRHIEEFKKKEGIYPDSLDQLIPMYFKKIPVTSYSDLNNDFYYEKYSDSLDGYALWYYVPLGVEVRYNSITKEWTSDD